MIPFFIGLAFIFLLGWVTFLSQVSSKQRVQPKTFYNPTPQKVEERESIPSSVLERMRYFAMKRKNAKLDNQANYQGLKGFELELSAKNVDQKKTDIVLFGQSQFNEIDQREIALANQGIELKEAGLEIGRQHLEVQREKLGIYHNLREQNYKNWENRLVVQQMTNDANNKVLESKINKMEAYHVTKEQSYVNREKEIEHGKQKLDIQSREVELEKRQAIQEVTSKQQKLKEMVLDFVKDKLTFQEQQMLAKVRNEKDRFDLYKDKALFNISKEKTALEFSKERALLDIYHKKLTVLQYAIVEDYKAKMQWLKIQERHNHNKNWEAQLRIREDKLSLQKVYDRTMAKLEELQLAKRDYQLGMREDEVNKKWEIIQYLEGELSWLLNFVPYTPANKLKVIW